MVYSRFNAQRGGVVRLETRFYANGVLTDPYSVNSMSVDILDSTGTALVSGLYFGSSTPVALSGLTPYRESTGYLYYDLQTISGMQVGSYFDRWNSIQLTELDPLTSGVFPFTISFNEEDLADWDIQPG